MSADLPPEAYTRETLQKAFEWLQEQPEPVKASVHTPERLVALFQKSQRTFEDAPVSSKKFMSDLKDLASTMDEFDSSKVTAQIPSPQPVFDFTAKEAKVTPSPAAPTITETKKATFEVTTQTNHSTEELLDPISKERISTIKERFNLSSDAEALRLLISLGYEKFSTFP